MYVTAAGSFCEARDGEERERLEGLIKQIAEEARTSQTNLIQQVHPCEKGLSNTILRWLFHAKTRRANSEFWLYTIDQIIITAWLLQLESCKLYDCFRQSL